MYSTTKMCTMTPHCLQSTKIEFSYEIATKLKCSTNVDSSFKIMNAKGSGEQLDRRFKSLPLRSCHGSPLDCSSSIVLSLFHSLSLLLSLSLSHACFVSLFLSFVIDLLLCRLSSSQNTSSKLNASLHLN